MTAKLPRCPPAKLFRQSATVADASCQAVKLPSCSCCAVAQPSCQTAKLSSYPVVKQSSSQTATVAHPSCQAVKLPSCGCCASKLPSRQTLRPNWHCCKAGLPSNQAVHLLPAHLVIKPLFPLPLAPCYCPSCCPLVLSPAAALLVDALPLCCCRKFLYCCLLLLLHCCCWCCCCRCLLLHCCLLLLLLPPAAVSHSALVVPQLGSDVMQNIVCDTKSLIFVIVITIPCKTIRKKKNDNKKRVMQKVLGFSYHLIWYIYIYYIIDIIIYIYRWMIFICIQANQGHCIWYLSIRLMCEPQAPDSLAFSVNRIVLFQKL